MNPTRLLNKSDMATLLNMPDVINVVEQGFSLVGGEDHVPIRLPIEVADHSGVVLFMPAYLSSSQTLGAKIISCFSDNPSLGHPTITGFYVLSDAKTGRLLALMDATFLTGIRTAAASAIATKYLARNYAKVLGVIGAGLQGRFHVDAIRSVRPIEQTLVYNRTPERGSTFVDDLVSNAIPSQQAKTVSECVTKAEILVVCTSSQTPVFDGSLVQPGTHINAVGAFTPETRELDTALIQRSNVYVDTYVGVSEEGGDIIIPQRSGDITKDHIRAELSELVTGRKEGRIDSEEITVFKSVGYAMEDAVTAKLAYERAVDLDIGTVFDLDA